MTPPPADPGLYNPHETTPIPVMLAHEKSGGNLRARDWVAILGVCLGTVTGGATLMSSLFASKAEVKDVKAEMVEELKPLEIHQASLESRLVGHVDAQRTSDADLKTSLKEISEDVKLLNRKLDRMGSGDRWRDR